MNFNDFRNVSFFGQSASGKMFYNCKNGKKKTGTDNWKNKTELSFDTDNNFLVEEILFSFDFVFENNLNHLWIVTESQVAEALGRLYKALKEKNNFGLEGYCGCGRFSSNLVFNLSRLKEWNKSFVFKATFFVPREGSLVVLESDFDGGDNMMLCKHCRVLKGLVE